MSDLCNCGNEHEDQEMEHITISIDGVDTVCDVLGVFECNDREYIALLPQEGDDAIILRYVESGDDVELSDIESDEEYETVTQKFCELLIDSEDEDDDVIWDIDEDDDKDDDFDDDNDDWDEDDLADDEDLDDDDWDDDEDSVN